MSFNPLPEEQEYPELINHLQEAYRMTPEDRASLARIQARLLQVAATQRQSLQPSSSEDSTHLQNGNISRIHPRSQKPWRYHLSMNVAVLLLLFTGVVISPFLLMKSKSQSSVINPSPIVSVSPQRLNKLMKPRPIGVAGAVHMISEQVGWAMGGNPNSNTPGPLLRTTDGGVHWQQVTPRGVSIQYIYYALPFDEDMAFLFVLSDQSHCYRTVDGGVTWQFIQLPAKMDQGSETFLDHFHGWANVIGANDQQTLFRTNDGGFTWQYVALFPFSGLFDFTFTDMQTAWLNAPLNNVGSPPTDALYVTHDGGHTWKQQPLPALPQRVLKSALNLGKPTFLTQQEGYFLIPILPFDSRDVDSAAYMYMTQDGGKSWQSRTTVLPTHVVVHNEVFYFVDATHILVKGVEPLLLTLINGKWVQTSSSPTNKYPADGDFVSARVGLVLLPANNSDTANTFDVYRTNDGGKTWQKIGILPTSS